MADNANRLLRHYDSPISRFRRGETNRLIAYPDADPEKDKSASNIKTLLEWLPFTGEAAAARDAWDASGDAANKMLRGDYSDALSDYGRMGLSLFGAIPLAGRLFRSADPERTASIFAGIGAKTADKDAMARAQQMEAEGVDPSKIWSETGWGRAADGEWRFEIDDSQARLAPKAHAAIDDGYIFSGTSREAIDHPDLHAAYELPDRVRLRKAEQRSGYYQPMSDLVEATGPREGSILGTSLHELQHAIQKREGFAQGSNPRMFTKEGAEDAIRMRTALAWQNEVQKSPGSNFREKEAALIREFQQSGLDEFIPDDGSRAVADKMNASPWLETYIQDMVKEYGLDRSIVPPPPRELYRRTAGEVEARNVETRQRMNPIERRATPPWETEDIPRDRQIVRGR